MRGYAKSTRSDKMPNASATESSPACATVNVASVEAATEVTEMTEDPETTEVTAEIEAEAVDVSMTGEEDIATPGRLLRGFATTDTEALLQRAELTATFQAAHTETTLPSAGAARPRIIALVAALLLLPQGAAAATPPASTHAPLRRLARSADVATTGPHLEMPATARMTTPRRKAKASVVTNTADPVRVLLLTSVAHDLLEDPTTPAAEGRLPMTADPLLRRNAAARPRPPSLDRRLAGAAMSPAQDLLHEHHRGVAKGEMTKM